MNKLLILILMVLLVFICINHSNSLNASTINEINLNENFDNWNKNCDYKNFNEPDMIILKRKNGSIVRFNTGVYIKNIPTNDVENISIKGYSTAHLRIHLYPYHNNMYIWKYYTNFNDELHKNINTDIIEGSSLPLGKIVEVRARCNKPINGLWSDWKITNPCHWETDGFCYYEKERNCACIKPAFGGMDCIGKRKLKIDCQCPQFLPKS